MSQRTSRLFVFFAIFLLFLSQSCKQNANQNASANTSNSTVNPQNQNPNNTAPKDNGTATSGDGTSNTGSADPDNQSTPEDQSQIKGKTVIYTALSGSTSPTLIYGSDPRFIKFEQTSDKWEAKLVNKLDADNASQDEDQIVLNFSVGQKNGLILNANQVDKYGLYFGHYPLKQSKYICGTNKCARTDKKEFLVVHAQKDQFDELLKNATDIDLTSAPTLATNWNLYLFDEDMSIQGQGNAKLIVAKDADGKTQLTFDLNNVIKTDPSSLKWTAKWIQLEKPVVVGTLAVTEGEYRIIGIESIAYKNNSPQQ